MRAILSRSAAACPDTRWTRLPDALLSVLSPREHQLVHALLSYRWTPDAPIYPSVRTLARRLGVSERTIQRTLRALEAGGWIVTEAHYRDDECSDQTSNRYRPGPMLLPLLTDAPVGRARDDRRPPVTRPADERDPGKNATSTRGRQGGYTQANVDPAAFTGGRYGAFIHT